MRFTQARHLNLAVWLALSGVVAWGCILARPAMAQDQRQRLEAEIRRTDEALAAAETAVSSSESERARHLLANAVGLQERAWHMFGRCGADNVTACRNSAEATIRARREALHAVQVARQQSGDEQRAQQSIDRAQHLLAEAHDLVKSSGGDERALQALTHAERQLQSAREQYQERNYAIALRLADNAVNLMRTALRYDADESLAPERVELELERTGDFLERALAVVQENDSDRARLLINKAFDILAQARGEFEHDRLLRALRLTREARSFAERALHQVVDGPVDPNVARKSVAQTAALIERVEAALEDAQDERAEQLLKRAIQRQERAQELVDGERWKEALVQTRVARNFANEAMELLRAEQLKH